MLRLVAAVRHLLVDRSRVSYTTTQTRLLSQALFCSLFWSSNMMASFIKLKSIASYCFSDSPLLFLHVIYCNNLMVFFREIALYVVVGEAYRPVLHRQQIRLFIPVVLGFVYIHVSARCSHVPQDVPLAMSCFIRDRTLCATFNNQQISDFACSDHGLSPEALFWIFLCNYYCPRHVTKGATESFVGTVQIDRASGSSFMYNTLPFEPIREISADVLGTLVRTNILPTFLLNVVVWRNFGLKSVSNSWIVPKIEYAASPLRWTNLTMEYPLLAWNSIAKYWKRLTNSCFMWLTKPGRNSSSGLSGK